MLTHVDACWWLLTHQVQYVDACWWLLVHVDDDACRCMLCKVIASMP